MSLRLMGLMSGLTFPSFYNNLIAYWNLATPFKYLSYQPDALRDLDNGMYLGKGTESNVSGPNGGKAVAFDNTNSLTGGAVDANTSFGNFGNTGTDVPFTIRFWFYPTLSDGNVRIVFSKRLSAASIEYQLYYRNGKLNFSLWQAGGTSVSIGAETTGTFSINTGYWITITYDGSKSSSGVKIYENGVIDSFNPLGTTYTGMSNTGAKLSLGKHGYTYSAKGSFTGKIAEFGVFDKELTSEEVLEDYEHGQFEKYVGETEKPFHFETSITIIDTNGDYILASDGTNLLLSEDGGATYPNTNAWGAQYSSGNPIYNKKIDYGKVFDDGTILLACTNVMYRSTDKLTTISPITVYLSDGVTPLPIHTPSNAVYPGSYYQSISKDSRKNYLSDGETEIEVSSNYANVERGAAPITVIYTIDKGATVKSVYRFGQNPDETDDGTDEGGTGGTAIGDAGNSTICRHSHGTIRRPGTNEWWTVTGDGAVISGNTYNEIHWIRHTYDEDLDTWSHEFIIENAAGNGRFKCVGLAFDDEDNVYWISDANEGTVPTSELGIFKADASDPENTSVRIADPNAIFGGTRTNASDIKIVGDKLVASANVSTLLTKLMISENLGSVMEYRDIYGVIGTASTMGNMTALHPDYITTVVGWLQFEPKKTIWVKK